MPVPSAFLRALIASAALVSSIASFGQTPAPSAQPAAPTQPQSAQPAQPQPPVTQQPTLQQHPGEPLDPNIATINVNVRQVNLAFTVTNNKGQFVTNLKQQYFSLLDDGRPPERVVRFLQQTDLPLRVGLMIDTSTSIRQRFSFEQQAAIDFFLQTMRNEDRGFVEGFDVQTDLSQDYTNRLDLLDTGIHKLRPGGGTALFDSVYKTCRDQMLTLQDATPVRRTLVLLSDGDDNYSRATEADAIKMCQRAETIVYTISTNVGPNKDKGDDILQRMADATGGRAFYPTRIEDLSQGFFNIEQELRSQYYLEYVPADFKPDGSFRSIYLVSNDQRFTVHARKGYFSTRR